MPDNAVKFLASVLFLFLSLFLLPAPAGAWPGRVIAVEEGDALTVEPGRTKTGIRINLYGIDCPERDQPYGARARQATADAVLGREVNVHPVDPVDPERYGNGAALVAAPGREMLNSWLVREGLAWVCPQLCARADICDRLRELERTARESKAGLWADREPTPPWIWRQKEIPEKEGNDLPAGRTAEPGSSPRP
ncbi:MAG: thermonuclease family protein [Desulfovibrio sp.]|jgi:endonuclease YncB( thermonuclease family)|nr:thermonuclease family protein [Desulfovibrio sp.]